MIHTLAMIGPSATPPAIPSGQNPLRAALAFGDRLLARNADALESLLLAQDRSLLSEAIVFQVQGMIASLSRTLLGMSANESKPQFDALCARLAREDAIRVHCHSLALEWRLATRLEAAFGLDPVLSPSLRKWVGHQDKAAASVAMAALAAQARFVQSQRRMELEPSDLPAELFHLALVSARDLNPESDLEAVRSREADLRRQFDEGGGRLTLQSRLATLLSEDANALLDVRQAGVGLWLSALSLRTGELREQIAFATVEPLLGRLLLTLRAAGSAPRDAEVQALVLQPDAALPRGLDEVGTREAAQWLAETRSKDVR